VTTYIKANDDDDDDCCYPTVPCEMQKSYFGRLQQWIHTGGAYASAQKDLFQRTWNNQKGSWMSL